jgi:hypothetical protein
LDFLIENVQGLGKFSVHGLAGRGPFDEDRQVVAPLLERQHEIAILLEAPAALQDLLGFGLVLPEIRRGGARLETVQFVEGTGGFKDSSVDRQRAC